MFSDLEFNVETVEDTTLALSSQVSGLEEDVLGLDGRVTVLEAGDGGSGTGTTVFFQKYF